MTISETNLPALAAFAEVAGRYLKLIEGLHAGRPHRLYCQLEELLQSLHQAILPVESEMARDEHAEFDTCRMTEEQAAATSRLIDETVCPEKHALMAWHKDIAGGDKATIQT